MPKPGRAPEGREATSLVDDRERFMKMTDLTRLLGISEKIGYKLLQAEPTLPRVWVGATVRFPRDRVMRWLADKRRAQRGLAITRDRDRGTKKRPG